MLLFFLCFCSTDLVLYCEAFLTTYRTFITPEDLIKKLHYRYPFQITQCVSLSLIVVLLAEGCFCCLLIFIILIYQGNTFFYLVCSHSALSFTSIHRWRPPEQPQSSADGYCSLNYYWRNVLWLLPCLMALPESKYHELTPPSLFYTPIFWFYWKKANLLLKLPQNRTLCWVKAK